MSQLTANQQLDLAKYEERYLSNQRSSCTCGYHGYDLDIPFGDAALSKIEQCPLSIRPFRVRTPAGYVDGHGRSV